jgi:hypothetical protein
MELQRKEATYHGPSAIPAVGASISKMANPGKTCTAVTALTHTYGIIIFHHIQYV